MPIVYDDWILEEKINQSSNFGYLPEDMLAIFRREYIERFPGDPRGDHFNENMGITEWDE